MARSPFTLCMRRTSLESVWTHNGSALAAMHLHEWERVEYHSRAGLALDPQLHSEVNNLGMAMVHLGRYQEAVECFREAARLMPTDRKSISASPLRGRISSFRRQRVGFLRAALMHWRPRSA